MATQLTPQMLVNIPIFLLAASLAAYGVVRYRGEVRRQELLAFVTLMVGVAFWQLTNLLRELVTDPWLTLRVYHVFVAVVIPLFTYSLLWFALAYRDASRRHILAVGGLFLGHVFVMSVAIGIDPEFFHEVDGVVYQGPVTMLNVTFEQWAVLDRTFTLSARLHQLYSYVVWMAGGAILVQYILKERSDMAVGQVVAISVGIGTTVVVSSLLFFGVLPPELALTDMALGLLAVSLAVAVFRYRLLDLAVVGRRQFVAGMEDPLVFVNHKNDIVYSNPTAREMFDAPSRWTGMDANEFFGSHTERVQSSNADKLTHDDTIELADSARYFDVKSTAIRTPAGKTGGRAIALREVTELKNTNRRLDRFASMVSHDLRTQLNRAMYHMNHIERERSDDRTEAVRESLERMESITDGMLTLARAGKEIEATEECSLGELVDEVWETLETDGARLDCRVEDATIEADQFRLHQVLENLLRNAIDHNDSPLTVRVGTLGERSELPNAPNPAGFFIEDDGSGIPEDQRDEIFEHGYTTNRDGNGYGLSIVRSIVEAHDWEIRITDGRDGGTRFDIVFSEAD